MAETVGHAAALRVDDGEVHLWSVVLDRPADEVADCALRLSAEERTRAARFLFERDRRRFTVAHAALRGVLARYGGGDGDARQVRFDLGPFGKPALCVGKRGRRVEFNLAHSQDLALIAVGAADGGALGVDVEAVRRLDDLDGLAAQVCSPAERRALRELADDERAAAFLRCWTRKEACVKAIGRGLSHPLEGLHVGCHRTPSDPAGWSLSDLGPAPGFVGALATRRRASRIAGFVFDGLPDDVHRGPR